MRNPLDRRKTRYPITPPKPDSERVAAVLCADLHLQHKPPRCRAGEKSWYAAMEDPLNQLAALSRTHTAPVVCAGDIFDKWNPGPELINWAIMVLPKMFAVAGNHDLPHHRYEDVKKSSFWTLVKAGIVFPLEPNRPKEVSTGLRLHGFPCGHPVKPLENPHDLMLEVAVVHDFIWTKRTGYPGASRDSRLPVYTKKLRGYDVAVFGDNHKPFHSYVSGLRNCEVLNCGSLMRRTIDQKDYTPHAGLLFYDGHIERVSLDCSQDVFEEGVPEGDTNKADFSAFVAGLEELGECGIDFPEAVRRVLREVDDEAVRAAVLRAMENKK